MARGSGWAKNMDAVFEAESGIPSPGRSPFVFENGAQVI